MKTLLLLLLLYASAIVRGQTCTCDQNTMLKENISCKPKYFDNNSKLFWNFNCDSSWLTFEASTGKQKIIFSLGDGLVGLTNRLGYVDFTEFRTTFLITNSVISGCCAPHDYYVYDKTSGNLIKYLGRAIYISQDKKIPIVVSITKSNYDTISKTDYNSLTIYNLDKKKEYKLSLPKGDIEKGMKNNTFMFPEYVFETPKIEKDKLILLYFIQKYRINKSLNFKTIIIDLKKYSPIVPQE